MIRIIITESRAGLDHLYSNKPEKLSSVQTYLTGMSDHMLLKVTRFSKSFRQNPRFIRKRMFKNFDSEKFRQELVISQLEEIKTCTDVITDMRKCASTRAVLAEFF